MKNIKKILFIVSPLLCVLLLFLFFSAFIFYIASPVNSKDVNNIKVFSVENGERLRGVIQRLKKDGLIRSEIYSLAYAKWKHINVKTGIYDFSPSFSTAQILALLAKGGREELIKVTIPEGLTIKKTAAIFEKQNICSCADFVSACKNESIIKDTGLKIGTLEGFLFPDTYLISKKDNAESIVRIMVKNFFSKTISIPNFPQKKEELYNMLKLASIIEREYQMEKEAPIISGVFANRLRIHMPLQSCATVEYIITEIEGKPHPKRLFWDDIQIKNEYNTYIHQGLPPSPIANPGLISINAACNPEKTDYLYFRLVDAKEGRHAFSTNVADHNKIGNQYLLKH